MLGLHALQAAATWFVVVGKPATAYSAYVVSWIVFFSLVLLASGDSVLRAAIAIDEEVAAQAGLVRRLVLEYQLAKLERSSLAGRTADKQTPQYYNAAGSSPPSRTPSPTVDLGIEEHSSDTEITDALDREENFEFHTPSRRNLPRPQPQATHDEEEELQLPVPMGVADGLLTRPSPVFQVGSEPRPDQQANQPSPPGGAHEKLPSQVLHNDVLAMLIEEIMDDNSNPVRLSFFGACAFHCLHLPTRKRLELRLSRALVR